MPAEQACPDRRTALGTWLIGHHARLLAGFDILNLEVALVGDDADRLDVE